MKVLLFALNNWKLILFAATIAILTATAGFYKMRAEHWKGKYETFEAQVNAAGAVAEAKAREKEAAQKKATQEVRINAKKDRDRISAYYERRLLDASAGGLSSPTGDPGRTDAAPAEQVASGPGFERACALDADQVLQFQSWVKAQGIPVR